MEEHHNDDDMGDDMLTLPPLTLAALASFLDEQSADQQALADLKVGSYDFGGSKTQIYQDNEESTLEVKALTVEESSLSRSKQMVTLKDFKRIFK